MAVGTKMTVFWKTAILNNQKNFSDLSIRNENNKLEYRIFINPTTTDIIIPNNSCYSLEHRKAAIHHMINRLHTYPISKDNKIKESNIINTILLNNNYLAFQSLLVHKALTSILTVAHAAVMITSFTSIASGALTKWSICS
jgi:hypothetical protein